MELIILLILSIFASFLFLIISFFSLNLSGELTFLVISLLFLLILGLLFLRKQIGIFLIFSIFFGTMSIMSGFVFAPLWLSYSKIGILGVGALFLVGILAFLPSNLSKKILVRIINFLVSMLIVLIFIFNHGFFIKIPGGYSGDWEMIPFVIYGSLLFGLFCLPFLILKSRRVRKVVENPTRQL